MLKGPLTSLENLMENKDQVLLIAVSQQQVIGLLKYGYKDLFCYTKKGQMKEMRQSLSLLDFYVFQEYQRQGIAQALLKLAQNEFECPKLSVNKKNTTAISLYEKVGYETFKEEGAMLHMERLK